MERIIVLTIIFASSPKEKRSEIYVYDKKCFMEKITKSSEMEHLKEKYLIEDEFTWHFLNAEKMQEFLDKELSENFGKINIDMLSGYTVRSLNYRHTGVSMRRFEKGMVYIGKNNSTYICLEGTSIYDAKWLQTEVLREYNAKQCNQMSFQIPKGTVFDVMNWFQLESEIVNVIGRAELQEYKIEAGKAVFI